MEDDKPYQLALFSYEKGRKLLESEEYPAAFAAFEEARQQLPNLPDLKRCIGLTLLNLCDFRKAVNVLRRAVDEEPGNPLAYTHLAAAYLMLGDEISSEETLKRGLQRIPDNADLHYSLGTRYSSKGAWGLAEEHFETALRLDPCNYHILVNLAQIKFGYGDVDEAMSLYHRAAEAKPGDELALSQLLLVLGQKGALGCQRTILEELRQSRINSFGFATEVPENKM